MSAQGYGLANAAQGMNLGGLQNMANQMFNSQYNTYKAQQTQAAQYNQMLAQGLARQRTEWMIAGRAVSFDEFLNELAPGDDNPMRTFLTLKYKR